MKSQNLKDLEERYGLEFERLAGVIKKRKSKTVLLQFPDGLKPYATKIVDYLQKICRTTEFTIWADSCFGACDVPETKNDLVVQFGHAPWK